MSEVFLVEDSDLDILVFERLIELSTVKSCIVRFNTAQDCIAELNSRMVAGEVLPCLIVLDIFLNGDRGELVLDFIKNQMNNVLPVVILSASKALVNEKQVLSNRCVLEFSEKPFTKVTLDSWISSQLIA